MVSRRGRHNPFRTDATQSALNLVRGPSQLEGSGSLEILQLEVNLAVNVFAEKRAVYQRGAKNSLAKYLIGSVDVVY
jgi:hypothetical protein